MENKKNFTLSLSSKFYFKVRSKNLGRLRKIKFTHEDYIINFIRNNSNKFKSIKDYADAIKIVMNESFFYSYYKFFNKDKFKEALKPLLKDNLDLEIFENYGSEYTHIEFKFVTK